MPDLVLHFEAQVVEDQRLLNGARYLAIEGEAEHEGTPWTLTLSFERPKGADSPIEEGDLTLAAPTGALFAGLESGGTDMVFDEAAGAERDVYELVFRVNGGDDQFQDWQGQIGIRAELDGVDASITVALRAAAAPANS
jgi:hypothetical protein